MSDHNQMIEELLPHTHALATIMGEISAHAFYDPITIQTKHDKSFVTAADTATEQAAKAYLQEHRPTDLLWGKELGKSFSAVSDEDIVWVIDPIDGTKAFMDGIAYWTNLIAVFKGSTLLFGMINQPITGERCWGGEMVPSVYSYIDPMTQERQTVSMRCAKVTDISRLAWRSTTKNYMLPIDKAGYDALATVAPPREGGDGMLYLSLARGRTLNCVYDGDLAPWDIAAPAAVVLGAGGVITDAQGQPLNFMRDGKTTVVAAATPALHAAVLGIIQQGAQNVGL